MLGLYSMYGIIIVCMVCWSLCGVDVVDMD